MAFNEIEWRRKALKRQTKIDEEFSKETDDYKKMLLVLEDLDLSIHPHSLHGRLGYKKYLKMALKILKERKNNEKEVEVEEQCLRKKEKLIFWKTV